MAQWIRRKTLNREVCHVSELAAAIVPLGKALYPNIAFVSFVKFLLLKAVGLTCISFFSLTVVK